MKRLSGLDATFLYIETPSMHMHVSGIGVFDPSTSPSPLDYEGVVRLTEERLHLAPVFRQRLVTVPFELHHPVWIQDPDFDIRFHVRRAALPSPGGRRELAAFAADVTSRPLDRSRPLWEMYVVEGLADGNIGVVTKTHHATIDGVSGMEMTLALLDLTPEPAPVAPPDTPWAPEAVPSDLSMLGYAVNSLARQPVRVARALPKTARTGLNLLQNRRRTVPELAPPAVLFRAPRTSLNVAISPRRSFAYADVGLDDLKSVKNAVGGTLNDVVLAVTAGGLLRWFEAKDEHHDRPLVAMVPISVRTDEQSGTLGNQVSAMLVSLATDIADPIERLKAISASTAGAKESHRAIGATTLQDWAEFAAPAVAARAARLYSRTRLADRHRPPANLIISNVPGPPFPLYSFGAKMVATYPMGPIPEGNALNVTVTSYQGRMAFGLHACADAIADPWDIAESIEAAAAELLEVAAPPEPTSVPGPKPRSKPRLKPRAKKPSSR